jgi:GT2 family glycosyltransferase
MGVDVVIVNWNGGPELIRAVKSVQRFGGRPIMVGNASTEGSINDLTAAARVTRGVVPR